MTGGLDSFWRTVRKDRSRGSSELLRYTLNRLEDFLSDRETPPNPDLTELVESLKSVRPEMSLLVNAGYLLESRLARSNTDDDRSVLLDGLRSIRKTVQASSEGIARNLHQSEFSLRKPLIFSRSGTVLSALSHCQDVEHVSVLESRPGGEGIDVANELEGSYSVTFYYDLEAQSAFENSDVFLLGADSFRSDGSLRNKTGTGLLAHVGRDIPVVSCFQTLKYEPETSESVVPTTDSPDSLKADLGRSHPLFEWVSPERIDWFVTERKAVNTVGDLRSQVETLRSLRE